MNLGHLFAAGNFPSIERDPVIRKLENDVFGQIHQIIKTEIPKEIPQPGINFVSVEDALKELLQMGETRLF